MNTIAKKTPAATKEIALPDALKSIDVLTLKHAFRYNALADKMRQVDEELAAVKNRHMEAIRALVAVTKQSHEQLSAAIAAMPKSFASPRTRELHGFKVGLRKQKGKVKFFNELNSIALIESELPKKKGVLIKTEKSIIKDAAKNLSAAELASIGGELEATTDVVEIKCLAGEVSKLVDALIKGTKDELEGGEA